MDHSQPKEVQTTDIILDPISFPDGEGRCQVKCWITIQIVHKVFFLKFEKINPYLT